MLSWFYKAVNIIKFEIAFYDYIFGICIILFIYRRFLLLYDCYCGRWVSSTLLVSCDLFLTRLLKRSIWKNLYYSLCWIHTSLAITSSSHNAILVWYMEKSFKNRYFLIILHHLMLSSNSNKYIVFHVSFALLHSSQIHLIYI